MVIKAVGEEEIMMIGLLDFDFFALFGSTISSVELVDTPVICDDG